MRYTLQISPMIQYVGSVDIMEQRAKNKDDCPAYALIPGTSLSTRTFPNVSELKTAMESRVLTVK